METLQKYNKIIKKGNKFKRNLSINYKNLIIAIIGESSYSTELLWKRNSREFNNARV